MPHKKFSLTKIIFVAMLATIGFVLTVVAINIITSTTATAQEPTPTPIIPLSQETLNAFGLSEDSIHTFANEDFDLVVDKRTNTSSVASGGTVIFTIDIINNGPTQASGVLFYDDYPSQMSNVQYTFSTAAISDGTTKPTWLLTTPIPAGDKAVVTVTGRLVSGSSTMVKNTASALPFYPPSERTPANNTDDVNVNIIAGGGPVATTIYLPVIFKAPPRVLLVSDNFSSSSSGWTSADDSNCERGYADNQYRMAVDNDETCFTPAPGTINGVKTEYTYAEYQVSAQLSSGSDDFAYGLYMNGAGGDNYYLLKIKPDDNCGWSLIRRKNGSNSTLNSGGCSGSGINTSSPWNNTFAIRHDKNGLISIFVNDQANNNQNPLFTINDGNQLTGKGVGLYVQADDSKDITVRFDNFQVYTVAP